MADYFFDTSALVKAYMPEVGTAWVRSLLDPDAGNDIFVLRLTSVEMTSAITRRQRSGSLTADSAAIALSEFRAQLASDLFVAEITDTIVGQAIQLVERHGLRAYDALQLSAAVDLRRRAATFGLQSPVFVSADTELNAAALREGLVVENPLNHP